MQMRIANNKGIGTTKKQAKPITQDQETVLWQYFLNKERFWYAYAYRRILKNLNHLKAS